jgi:L-aminopeptidase/D-esterase-like protein
MRLLAILVAISTITSTAAGQDAAAMRARDLGIPFDGTPGPYNAITDVPGVLVGHTTLVNGEGANSIRTGVTAILPRRELGYYPAATFVLNGDAELSGAIFAEEFGMLRSPIMLTGTGSNGTVFTSVIKWSAKRFPKWPVHMPVVADTWDADLSNYLAFPLNEEHVFAALDGATSGPVVEGSVGGGTGMVCHGFKCGIGTSSRVLKPEHGGFVVGVLVQANYGERAELRVAGIPVGREIAGLEPEFRTDSTNAEPEADGSIIIVVGTNAPLSAVSLKALARRAVLGLARNGATANPFSGDVVLAFATTPIEWEREVPYRVRGETLFPYATEHLYQAAIEATEEAVINALVAGRAMTGLHGSRVHGLPHSELQEVLRKYRRLK